MPSTRPDRIFARSAGLSLCQGSAARNPHTAGPAQLGTSWPPAKAHQTTGSDAQPS